MVEIVSRYNTDLGNRKLENADTDSAPVPSLSLISNLTEVTFVFNVQNDICKVH